MRIFQRLIDRCFVTAPIKRGEIWWKVLAIPPAIHIFSEGLGDRIYLADAVANFLYYWRSWVSAITSDIVAVLEAYVYVNLSSYFAAFIPFVILFVPIIARIEIYRKIEPIPHKIIRVDNPKASELIEAMFLSSVPTVIVILIVSARLELGFLSSAIVFFAFATFISHSRKRALVNRVVVIGGACFLLMAAYLLFWKNENLLFTLKEATKWLAAFIGYYGMAIFVLYRNWRIQFIVGMNVVLFVLVNFSILAIEPVYGGLVDWYQQTRMEIEADP